MSILKTTTNANINYLAKIVKLSNVRKHTKADRLQCVMIDGNNVIVGIDVHNDDIGVFFPLESQINQEFLSALSLFRDKELNKDKEKAGFFENHRRVRALKLRDERSEGFWIELDKFCEVYSLKYDDVAKLVGTEFNLVKDSSGREIELCKKFHLKNSLKEMRAKGMSTKRTQRGFWARLINKFRSKPEDILLEGQFNFHIDTPQLAKNIHRVEIDDHVTITQKMHGTSFICSKILTKRKLSLPEKISKVFKVKIDENEYTNLYSSRRVIKNLNKNAKNHFYKVDIWELVNKKIVDSLRPGMTVYGEIVGFLPTGEPIQKGYDYGCASTEYKFYIYRITTTDPLGHVLDWSWEQIKAWCSLAGFNHVPELYSGYMRNWKNGNFNFENLLEELKSEYLEKKCWNCNNDVWDEGIILRRDNYLTFNVFKLKSFNFWQYETKMLDDGIVDLESAEDELQEEQGDVI